MKLDPTKGFQNRMALKSSRDAAFFVLGGFLKLGEGNIKYSRTREE